ncbi:MAG: hypothetical protein HY369_01835 [Candidatus Aenigmarchaeota archaeon]|nr:hypothetical protein [Candidatus Aenigmarchaeota archaeon]
MNTVDFPALLQQAQRCAKGGVPWHFHILTPSCRFNAKKEFTIIFENEATKEQLASSFAQKPLAQGEKLEALFYGRV